MDQIQWDVGFFGVALEKWNLYKWNRAMILITDSFLDFVFFACRPTDRPPSEDGCHNLKDYVISFLSAHSTVCGKPGPTVWLVLLRFLKIK